VDISLRDKKALVTGGSRGIGRAIVIALARAGAEVVTCFRNDGAAVDGLREDLEGLGAVPHLVKADVTRPDEVERLVAECRSRLGRLDAVVNNAGMTSHVPFERLSAAEWRASVDTNLTSAMLVVQKCLPLLAPGASIVNMGSRAATVGVPLRAHYTAAKAGLIGLTRSLAKELGPRGFRVNVVAPGPVATETDVPEEVLERYRSLIALGRLGRPEEIANVVLFLISDASGFVSGETIHVDGGV